MTFAVGQDALWIYEAYPAAASRCHVVQTICFAPEAMAAEDFPAKSAAYCRRMDDAINEDIPALENQQRGMNSPDARAGRFSPRLEPNVASFAAWYAGRLTRLSNAPPPA